MRRGQWISLVMLVGCSSSNVERQSIADGTWRIKCKFALAQCVKEVEQVCPNPNYQIAGGNSLYKTYGVDPGKTEVRTSELTVTCGRDAVEQAESKAKTADAGAPDAAPRAPSICTPGVTQSCLGPGACAGAQACRTDGTGFMGCDCGGAPKASVADAGIVDAAASQ